MSAISSASLFAYAQSRAGTADTPESAKAALDESNIPWDERKTVTPWPPVEANGLPPLPTPRAPVNDYGGPKP